MRTRLIAALVIILGLVAVGGIAQARTYSEWATAQPIEHGQHSSEMNTPYLDGCPIQAPDGLSVYLASNRPRFAGDTRTDLDIWVAERASTDAPFGAPVNMGAPVNSAWDDFCPTPLQGNGLLFVSRRITAESCGLGDIYLTRRNPKHGWDDPVHLPCDPFGPNSSQDEQGPSYVTAGSPELYFSRGSMSVPGDIFVSPVSGDHFGPAHAVAALNDPTANDIQPNVRKDGRELVFSSNRTGSVGGQDIWVATREQPSDPWSTPAVNLGAAVNTAAGESRPSLSWDGHTLLFGRAPGPEGASDIFVTTRQ